MDENSGALEEKKHKRGGKRLMSSEAQEGAARQRSGRGWKALLITVCVLAAAYLGLGAWVSASQRIYPNVMLGGVNYGGMTQQEAADCLSGRIIEARGSQVVFVALNGNDKDVVASVDLDRVPDTFDCARYADAMYQLYGCTDDLLVSGAKYLRALVRPQEVSISIGGDAEASLAELSQEVRRALECEPVEFSISVTEDGRVSVTKPKDGRHVTDRDRADSAILAALRSSYFGGGYPIQVILDGGTDEDAVYAPVPAQTVDLAAARESIVGQKANAAYDAETDSIIPGRAGAAFTLADLQSAYDAAAPGETFTVKASVELPDVTAEQLREVLFRDELSSYTTRVGGAPGRHKNVQLTASRIDGYVINPGETMKYSPLVTPFTAANGYSPAPGYLKGKTVDMVGGGACQASSTLYAAALYADLEIVQRTNHGFASDYIGLGLDATVAEGGPEFEFRNNTLYPIKVRAEFFTQNKKDYIKVTLLGTKTDDSYVKIRTEMLETIPFEEEIVETDELAPGERKVEQTAYTGYRVKTYRSVYSGDGKLISSTFEASSNYKARNRIVLVGKSAASAPSDSGTATPSDPGTATPSTPDSPDAPFDPSPDVPAAGTGTAAETPEQEMPGWLKNTD